MAYVVLFLRENGVIVLILAVTAKVSQLRDLNPPFSSLTQMVVHLVEYLIGNIGQVHLLEPFFKS
jgi:hypothetical protein